MLIGILSCITAAVTVLTLYKFVYMVIGFFAKEKTFTETSRLHKYGIVIAARNEEKVIGNLLDSIQAQDYDMSLVDVFVVADNCTDKTSEICRAHGANVYERDDPGHARKGYALEFLFDRIDKDYGIENYDGYIVFDADNILRTNFITEINKAFDTGADICVGYRNTKNFSENWISAAYGIHFMRSSFFLHRPRAAIGVSTHIAGTGWVVRSELLLGGWHCTSLTEDTQFTMDSIVSGHDIIFCEAAEFYDEQPHELSVALRQRIRWIKGRLACFFSSAPNLIKGMICSRGRRFSCYDMFFYLFPMGLFSFICSAVPAAADFVIGAASGKPLLTSLRSAADAAIIAAVFYWVYSIVTGALVMWRERAHIRCSFLRIIYLLAFWPWFDIVELPLAIVSLFKHVTWKSIKHDRDLTLKEIENFFPSP